MGNRMRFWRALHIFVNDLAHRYGGREDYGMRKSRHPLWRANYWLADRWVPEWVASHGGQDV